MQLIDTLCADELSIIWLLGHEDWTKNGKLLAHGAGKLRDVGVTCAKKFSALNPR